LKISNYFLVQLHCTLQITTNFTPEYRLRVGDYRVLFELQEQTVIIYRIAHRREIYQQR